MDEKQKEVVAALVSALQRARGFIANDTASDPEIIAAELVSIDEALTRARSLNQ